MIIMLVDEFRVQVVSHEKCRKKMNKFRNSMGSEITEGMICAGGVEGEDSCQVNRVPNFLKIFKYYLL